MKLLQMHQNKILVTDKFKNLKKGRLEVCFVWRLHVKLSEFKCIYALIYQSLRSTGDCVNIPCECCVAGQDGCGSLGRNWYLQEMSSLFSHLQQFVFNKSPDVTHVWGFLSCMLLNVLQHPMTPPSKEIGFTGCPSLWPHFSPCWGIWQWACSSRLARYN